MQIYLREKNGQFLRLVAGIWRVANIGALDTGIISSESHSPKKRYHRRNISLCPLMVWLAIDMLVGGFTIVSHGIEDPPRSTADWGLVKCSIWKTRTASSFGMSEPTLPLLAASLSLVPI